MLTPRECTTRRKLGAQHCMISIFYDNLEILFSMVIVADMVMIQNKKAVLSQENRAMPPLFSVYVKFADNIH